MRVPLISIAFDQILGITKEYYGQLGSLDSDCPNYLYCDRTRLKSMTAEEKKKWEKVFAAPVIYMELDPQKDALIILDVPSQLIDAFCDAMENETFEEETEEE